LRIKVVGSGSNSTSGSSVGNVFITWSS
jgi:hypothetical protein